MPANSAKAVLDYIAANVEDGETIIATLLGLGEKTSIGALFGKKAGAALGGDYLLVTDRKVAILKSGIGTWGTGSVGLKTKMLLFQHIASVDTSQRWNTGEIEIVSAGMIEKGRGGYIAGAQRDSVVQFEKQHYEEVQKLATRIRDLASQSLEHHATIIPVDVLDQIKKLAALRETGVLSHDEFVEQKQKLLSKL